VIRTLPTSIILPPARTFSWGRKPLVYESDDHGGAEAMGGEQRLRHAVAARAREHRQRALLLGTRARCHHRRVPLGRLSRRSLQLGVAAAPRWAHWLHRIRGPNDGTGTSSGPTSRCAWSA
jgi:hypothetical protein